MPRKAALDQEAERVLPKRRLWSPSSLPALGAPGTVCAVDDEFINGPAVQNIEPEHGAKTTFS